MQKREHLCTVGGIETGTITVKNSREVWGMGGTAQFHSVQSLSRVRFFVTPRTAARQVSLSITNSQSLLKLMSIEVDVCPFPQSSISIQ